VHPFAVVEPDSEGKGSEIIRRYTTCKEKSDWLHFAKIRFNPILGEHKIH